MALRIEDVSSLPGRTVVDQEGEEVGEIKEVYGIGDDGTPMWVVVEISTGGMGGDEVCRFVPLARLREEDDNLSVPYSVGHIERSPEVDTEDEISEDDENALRIYYSIDLADQEFRNEPQSYAAQVPEGKGPSQKVTDDLDDKNAAGWGGPADREDDDDEPESKGDSDSEDSGEQSDESEDSDDRESESNDSEDRESESDHDEPEDEPKGESKAEAKGESKDDS
jgi:sporulation protein YlmC with PRC-barrel domain